MQQYGKLPGALIGSKEDILEISTPKRATVVDHLGDLSIGNRFLWQRLSRPKRGMCGGAD